MATGDEKGRIRLSSIDLLPDEAEPEIVWALAELAGAKRMQKDVWEEFNARLADRGIGPVSHSAFGRYALRKRRAWRRLKETREIAAALTQTLDARADDDITISVAALIKQLVHELLENGGAVTPTDAMELARALQATVSAQRMSTERRQKIAGDIKDRLGRAVDAVAGELAKAGDAKPDGAEVLRKIREDIYGIFERGNGA